MPNLTVRSFAEMISLPAYQQSRILLEQKYPKKEPQVFKIPYYSESLSAIRKFYSNNNDKAVLSNAINHFQKSIKLDTKRNNNIRVISSFSKNSVSKRKLQIQPNRRYKMELGKVIIKLSFDLTVLEGKIKKFILVNFRNAPLDNEFARLSLELSQHIMKTNGVIIELKNLEFIDLFSDKKFCFAKSRKTTVTKLNQNVSIIEALWNTI